ncbi:hypothetical protein KW785_01325 [Candidatus Parcubacteria bacterium]|nr:hypothetical protein [Candidatus Parcubacteria bacterium]
MKPKKRATTLAKVIHDHEDEVIGILLNSLFWPKTLKAGKFYTRRSDDDDGLGNTISVFVGDMGSRAGDVFFDSHLDEHSLSTTHCFRTGFGGGSSPRVRNALMVLAIAIDLDNETRPMRMPEREYSLESLSDALLARLLLRQLWQSHDLGGTSYGRSLDNRMLEAAIELLPLPEWLDADRFSLQELLREKETRLATKPSI